MERLGDILKRRDTVDMTPTPAETARILAGLISSVESDSNTDPKKTLRTVRIELQRLAQRIAYLDGIARSTTETTPDA